MGMYSYFEREDIEAKDIKGLKQFIKEFAHFLWAYYTQKDSGWSKPAKTKEEFLKEYFKGENWRYSTIIQKGKDGKEFVTFQHWNDIKLISYWYTPDVIFLNFLSKYLEGHIAWDFENPDEAGRVYFEEGKTTFETGQMNWDTWKAEQIIGTGFREDNDKKALKTNEFKKLEELYLLHSL